MGASGLNSLSPLGGAGGILGAGSSALGGVDLTDKMSDIADRIASERQAQSGGGAPVEANAGGGSSPRSTDGSSGVQGPGDASRAQGVSRNSGEDLPASISGNKTLGQVAEEHGATSQQVMNALRDGSMAVTDASSSAGAE